MVMVYHFKLFNIVTGEKEIPPLKSTAERIKAAHGEIIEGTGQEVPESALDAEGRYDPDAPA